MEQLTLFPHTEFRSTHRPIRLNRGREWKIIRVKENPAPESMIQAERPEQAVEYWKQQIEGSSLYNPDVECLAVLILNAKLRVKGHYIVSVGGLNETMAHPREIYRLAVMAAAFSIVLMHNHPSGESDPSNADRAITRRVQDAGQLLGINLCDHIIVGHNRFFSFRETGMLR